MKSLNAYIRFALFLLIPFCNLVEAYGQTSGSPSTKKERNRITKGNKYYDEGNYKEAMQLYKEALEQNPSSAVGKFNLGLAELQIGSNPNDTTKKAREAFQSGIEAMTQVAAMSKERPDLASKANYNLGNVAFHNAETMQAGEKENEAIEFYKQAANYYKQALRLNPEDNAARRNLRITQLRIPKPDEGGGGGNDQDQEDQDQEQQN